MLIWTCHRSKAASPQSLDTDHSVNRPYHNDRTLQASCYPLFVIDDSDYRSRRKVVVQQIRHWAVSQESIKDSRSLLTVLYLMCEEPLSLCGVKQHFRAPDHSSEIQYTSRLEYTSLSDQAMQRNSAYAKPQACRYATSYTSASRSVQKGRVTMVVPFCLGEKPLTLQQAQRPISTFYTCCSYLHRTKSFSNRQPRRSLTWSDMRLS
jgi:hypothetical protein